MQIWIALGVGFQMLLRKLNRVSGYFLVSLNVSCGCRLRAPIAIPARGSRPRSQCGERQDSAGSRATQLQGARRDLAPCAARARPLCARRNRRAMLPVGAAHTDTTLPACTPCAVSTHAVLPAVTGCLDEQAGGLRDNVGVGCTVGGGHSRVRALWGCVALGSRGRVAGGANAPSWVRREAEGRRTLMPKHCLQLCTHVPHWRLKRPSTQNHNRLHEP